MGWRMAMLALPGMHECGQGRGIISRLGTHKSTWLMSRPWAWSPRAFLRPPTTSRCIYPSQRKPNLSAGMRLVSHHRLPPSASPVLLMHRRSPVCAGTYLSMSIHSRLTGTTRSPCCRPALAALLFHETCLRIQPFAVSAAVHSRPGSRFRLAIGSQHVPMSGEIHTQGPQVTPVTTVSSWTDALDV